MAKYKYLAIDGVNKAVSILEDDTGNKITTHRISFPIDAIGNTDYEEWKAWEAAGNKTDAAD